MMKRTGESANQCTQSEGRQSSKSLSPVKAVKGGGTALLLPHRNHQLQAMRGTAALCVTVGHCFATFAIGRIEEPTFHLTMGNAVLAVGQLLFQPNTAVIFFYVLSGLVLSESLRNRPDLKIFVVRRLWRLLPLMWTSIGVAIALRLFLPSSALPGGTHWLTDEIGRPLSWGHVATDIAGLSWHANPVLWSVQIELAMIVLLPVLMLASERLTLRMNIVAGSLLAALSVICWSKIPPWANAVLFAYCFYAGLILPHALKSASVRSFAANGWVATASLCILPVVDALFYTGRLWMPHKFVVDAVVSCQLIAFVLMRGPDHAARWLSWPLLVRLGDISFSFYVYSFPVQLVIAGWMLAALASAPSAVAASVLTLVITVATISISLVAAGISHRFLELPTMMMPQRRRLVAVAARA
jgi:peptidoglycan/LPS O-acetylase OafA/YrhL